MSRGISITYAPGPISGVALNGQCGYGLSVQMFDPEKPNRRGLHVYFGDGGMNYELPTDEDRPIAQFSASNAEVRKFAEALLRMCDYNGS